MSRGQTQGAPSGGKIVIKRAGATKAETALISRELTSLVVSGDWMRITEADGVLYADMLLGTAPAPVAPPPISVTPPPARDVWETLPPTWSGTWRGSSWRSGMPELVQGDGGWGVSQGAAWYGRKLTANGILASASVRLERMSYGSYGDNDTPTMRLLSGFEQSGTYPAIVATATGPVLNNPGSVAEWALPPAWITQINAGAAGGIGIGIPGAEPYMRVKPPTLTGHWT